MTAQRQQVRYVSVVETAKILRTALKAVFGKGTKFSVKSDQYSGGASIDVRWTDGPSEPQVQAITSRFEGATFDGMIDLKSSHYTEWQGETVKFGADYIFTRRDYTPVVYQRGVDRLAAYWGIEAPNVLIYPSGEAYCDPKHPTTRTRLYGRYDFSELVYQELQHTDAQTKEERN
jgi:hypothetical protein